jgi:DNA-binding transcriptional LysR family regulator
MTASSPPPFADLHLLAVLAQARSFTQVAAHLGISKASVSARIAQLEIEAGVPLVRRTTRSVLLTEAGQQLVDDTAGALAGVGQCFANVKELASTPRGLVRLTAPTALGRQFISAALARFLLAYPEIRVELELTDRLVNLARDGFDLAVRHSDAAPDTHVAWALCESRTYLMAAPAYLARLGAPKHPRDLANHRCIQYLRDGTSSQEWRFIGAGPGAPLEPVVVSISGPFRANNSESVRDALLQGLGIGLLPDFSAAPALKSGELVAVMEGWRPSGFFGSKIFAIRPWSTNVPRAVRLLVTHLQDELKDGFVQLPAKPLVALSKPA